MEIKIKHSNKDYESALILGLLIGVFLLPVINHFLFGWELLYANLILIFGLPLFCTATYFFSQIIFGKFKGFSQFIKFALIGVANTAINLGVFNYFVDASGLTAGIPLVIISSVSFMAAAINSYIWNTHWSFNEGFRNTVHQFEIFLIITFLGLLVNDIIIMVFISIFNTFGPPRLIASLANLAGILFAMFWNFFGYKFIVFKKGK